MSSSHKRIDLNSLTVHTGTGYPPPFDAPCLRRVRRRLGEAAGLTDAGEEILLEIGSRKIADEGEYSDIDMRFDSRG